MSAKELKARILELNARAWVNVATMREFDKELEELEPEDFKESQ